MTNPGRLLLLSSALIMLASHVDAATPNPDLLCMPCESDIQCSSGFPQELSLSCLPFKSEGAFCVPRCDGGCPQGYACTDLAWPDEPADDWCLPDEDLCPCTVYAIENSASTTCVEQNQWGICIGVRECTPFGVTSCSAPVPSPELCNGRDDDCDGAVDEAQDWGQCIVTSDWGFCPGSFSCINGQLLCSGPQPGPELCDGLDNNCNGLTDEGWPDWDGDGKKLCEDDDNDGDGVADASDNCLAVSNWEQDDWDNDGLGDPCDDDDDDDAWSDDLDCKPFDSSVFPDAVELCNGKDDNCNLLTDEGFPDTDADGDADCVDWDDDNDDVADGFDCQPLSAASFPGAPETCDGLDNDCDGLPDNNLPDADKDGIPNCLDSDADGDSIQDDIDNCPAKPNPTQQDQDQDGSGDFCDIDPDGDGVPIASDNCKSQFNPSQSNMDGDGWGDACDDDADGDGIPDLQDNCPATLNSGQMDSDNDGQGDDCDSDDDGDGISDNADCAPGDPSLPLWTTEACNNEDDDCDGRVDEGFPDGDFDGTPDCLDEDDDDDGDPDQSDCQPHNPVFAHGFPETCNGVDDDCDTQVDEDQPTASCGAGVCKHDSPTCIQGKLAFCNPFEGATLETCDGLDNDCDGKTDETFSPGTPCFVGQGDCTGTGTWACAPDGNGLECSAVQIPPDCAEKECGADGCGGSCGECDDSLFCTDDWCDEGVCTYQVHDGFCMIGAQCLSAGSTFADELCIACIPETSRHDWSTLSNGTPCGDGGKCNSGKCCMPDCTGKECGWDGCTGLCGPCQLQWCVTPKCVAGICQADGYEPGTCFIDGKCRQEGEFAGENPCRVCAPDSSLSSWTFRNLEACGENAFCWGSTCCDPLNACENIECGTGSCGQVSCGDCDCGSTCVAGQCLNTRCCCQQCGTDGCGGSCGQCPSGHKCVEGFCAPECDDGNEIDWDGCTQGVCSEIPVRPTPNFAQSHGSIATLADGKFMAAWSGPTLTEVSAVSYQAFAGSGLRSGTKGTANTCMPGKQDYVRLAGRPNGYVAVWQSDAYGYQEPAQDGSGAGVYGRLLAFDGEPMSEEFHIPVATSGNQSVPQVGVFADGSFVVAWRNWTNNASSVRFARFLADATRIGGESTVVSDSPGQALFGHDLAVLDGDLFVLAWTQDDDDWDYEVFAQVYSKTGDPHSDLVIVNEYHEYGQKSPSVAPAAGGGFIVGWTSDHGVLATASQDGSYEGVFMRMFNADGTPASSEVQIANCTIGPQTELRLAAWSDGRLLAAWRSDAPSNLACPAGPFFRLFAADLQPLGSQFRGNTWGDSQTAWLEDVATFDDGRFVMVFRENNSPFVDEIRMRFFTSNGEPCCTPTCEE